MKILVTLLLGIVSGFTFSTLCAEEVTTVTLPPFKVIADLYTIQVDYKNDVIDRARVRDVTPGSKPFIAGLRDGYTLVSIFGQPVIGMKRETFEILMERLPAPGSPKTLRFRRKPGILRSGRIIDVTFSVSPNKSEPNRPPEPMSPSVTDRAGARSAPAAAVAHL